MALTLSEQWILRWVQEHYKNTDEGRLIVAPILRATQSRNVRQLFDDHRAEFNAVVDSLEEFEWLDEEDRTLQFSLDPNDHA